MTALSLSAEDRRLLALVAVFAPAHATALLSRLATGGIGSLPERAAHAAAAPRRERLEALAAALEPAGPRLVPRESVETVATGERARVAAQLRALSERRALGLAAIGTTRTLQRLLDERLPGRTAVDRSPGSP